MKAAKWPTLPPENILEKEVKQELKDMRDRLSDLQQMLYAQSKFSVLIVLQGMDASGKDGAVKHIFSGVNPAGCRVKSFKVPTEEEQKHDFLWRIHKECPEMGMIQIFNRSHYEDVLVPTIQKLLEPSVIDQRIQSINAFEQLLINQQTLVLKFYLHVSEKEQLERIEERKTDPKKKWKFQPSDIQEIKRRDRHLDAYEKIITDCTVTPWHIIPSDKNWYKHYLILQSILEELDKYDIHFPK